MYIEPSTNIRLLHNVPLDTSYDHTIYFANETAQYDYFVSLQKYNLTNYTYQRVKRGVARVGIVAENLYDCNYMMFRNINFGSKWFYAFITGVEYVNNEMSEIYFELDVMQTWHFNYEMEQCYVDREHSETDLLGEHIEPETLATGEYMCNGNTFKIGDDLTKLCVIVVVNEVGRKEDDTLDETNPVASGTLYDGIFGGGLYYCFEASDINGIKALLTRYVQKPDNVTMMYMVPKAFVTGVNTTIPSPYIIPARAYGRDYRINLAPLTGNETLDGYKPKNKKLYTYPYNFYSVTNVNGSTLNVRYEFFENLAPSFVVRGSITMPVKGILLPINYKNAGDNIYETIDVGNFPMCSWNIDAFKAWVAQNTIPMAINASATMINTGITVASGLGATAMANTAAAAGATGAAASASPMSYGAMASPISMVGNILSQTYTASIAADIAKGSRTNGSPLSANRMNTFWGSRLSVTKEFAKRIDDYFTVFGYAVGRCKVPNRNSRPHWNYVKTISCTIKGSIPSDDMRRICSIYDKGITFWKHGSEVGNYSLDNSPA